MAIVDDRSVTDELLAAQVRAAVETLNAALAAAAKAGLRAEVETGGLYEIGAPQTRRLVEVRLSRPL